MDDAEFSDAADDAVRLAVEAQVRAGADVVTDGEQRGRRSGARPARAGPRPARRVLGAGRVLLNPDCGFATFADNPIMTSEMAEANLGVLAAASRVLRDRHG